MLDGLAAHKPPLMGIEGAELLLDGQKFLGVGYGRLDFEAVSDDACILQQSVHILLGEDNHFFGVKIGEGSPIIVALSQDGQPR